jgi:hypothetical protein
MTELPEDRRFEILLDVLCCVMTADGKASGSEKQQVAALMEEAGCQWTTDELGERISRFVSRVRTMGFPDVLHWTCDDARLLFNTGQGKFLEDHLRIAEAAPEIRPSERKGDRPDLRVACPTRDWRILWCRPRATCSARSISARRPPSRSAQSDSQVDSNGSAFPKLCRRDSALSPEIL